MFNENNIPRSQYYPTYSAEIFCCEITQLALVASSIDRFFAIAYVFIVYKRIMIIQPVFKTMPPYNSRRTIGFSRQTHWCSLS